MCKPYNCVRKQYLEVDTKCVNQYNHQQTERVKCFKSKKFGSSPGLFPAFIFRNYDHPTLKQTYNGPSNIWNCYLCNVSNNSREQKLNTCVILDCSSWGSWDTRTCCIFIICTVRFQRYRQLHMNSTQQSCVRESARSFSTYWTSRFNTIILATLLPIGLHLRKTWREWKLSLPILMASLSQTAVEPRTKVKMESHKL